MNVPFYDHMKPVEMAISRDILPFWYINPDLPDHVPSYVQKRIVDTYRGVRIVEDNGALLVYHDNYRQVFSDAWFRPFRSSEDVHAWIDELADYLDLLSADPTPRPGDLVYFAKRVTGTDHRFGMIQSGCYGNGRMQVCLSYSAFRQDRSVVCSGGPVPGVLQEELAYSGFTAMARFWRWKRGDSGADRGVRYQARVPVWIMAQAPTWS